MFIANGITGIREHGKRSRCRAEASSRDEWLISSFFGESARRHREYTVDRGVIAGGKYRSSPEIDAQRESSGPSRRLGEEPLLVPCQ
jgi:hypothetical protein